MEAFWTALAAQLIPAIGIILVGLATWAVAVLKQKTKSDMAKNALTQVDQIVGAVVGQLSKTVAEGLKKTAADGKLTNEQKASLKNQALDQINGLISQGINKMAGWSVTDLQEYINHKIEEQVLKQPETLKECVEEGKK